MGMMDKAKDMKDKATEAVGADEKIDEASLESMDASDPPAYGSPSRIGSPRNRRSPKPGAATH